MAPSPSPFRPSAEVRQQQCDEHGAYASRNVVGRIWSRCPQCSAIADEERQREAAQAEHRQAEARHSAAIAAARIPARFVGRSFDNFAATTADQQHALTVCRDYAESFADGARRGAGLILSGRPGTGKSHLAAAVLQSVLSQDVRYLTCMDLIRAVRDTWRRDSDKSETQLLGYLERLDLLVIDEVGMQYGTDGEQTIIFDVLDRRYREVRPTMLLTNQDRAGFAAFIGERTFDRLKETCSWVSFDWPSYRPTARKEAACTAPR